MRIVLFLFILILFTQAQAQVSRPHIYSPFDFQVDTAKPKDVFFLADSTAAGINDRLNGVLDSAYRVDKSYDFEFRLYKRTMTVNFDDVFILTLKNNKWSARYFDLKDSGRDGIKIAERPVDESKVNQLWELLVQHHILTLPDQNALRERMVTYVVDTNNLEYGSRKYLETTDGVLYSFELRTPVKKRSYSYGNPHAYLKQYGNIQELYNAVVIVLLIEKFLGQPLVVS